MSSARRSKRGEILARARCGSERAPHRSVYRLIGGIGRLFEHRETAATLGRAQSSAAPPSRSMLVAPRRKRVSNRKVPRRYCIRVGTISPPLSACPRPVSLHPSAGAGLSKPARNRYWRRPAPRRSGRSPAAAHGRDRRPAASHPAAMRLVAKRQRNGCPAAARRRDRPPAAEHRRDRRLAAPRRRD